MTSQQAADEMLAEHQAARFRLTVIRSDALRNFYRAQRAAGMNAVEANEMTAEHAKFLDVLEAVNVEMELEQ